MHQNWQAYVFFYHAMLVHQPGDITRIVSGCTKEEQEKYTQKHQEEVMEKMSNRFHIYFTPDFSSIIKNEGQPSPYVYINKPFGLRHWMDNFLGYPRHHKKHDDTIIALLDPDMFLTKPLVNNFTGVPTHAWYQASRRPDLAERCVMHGKPVAQHYGYRDDWMVSVGSHMVDVVGQNSSVHNVSNDDVIEMYAMGPPYLLTARDMHVLVSLWCDLVPKVHSFYPHLLAEMYGYSIAVAHLQLRHQLAYQMMVSDAIQEFEGWQFADRVKPEKACAHDIVVDLPTVVHYCQVYSAGPVVVTKYYMKDEFLSCEEPLLWHPPADFALQYKERIFTDGTMVPIKDLKEATRIAFLMCTIVRGLNQASSYYKQNHCNDLKETLEPLPFMRYPGAS